ncbi:Hypothetical protein CINCED_3A020073 [Cinara cedri]|uniref:Diablo homolog, mitochondrial n=1 Tax=Cinara cedri TaxID=506608 RepID=A0A5E4M1R7_9HEMI|nr:Hypothetical protein CINCED_3A020073 [Cinara cedri]
MFKMMRWHRLAVALAYCQTTTEKSENKIESPVVVELKQVPEQMTHKYLLQQTCALSVNSSCQMITLALVLLSDASQKYKNELMKVIDILASDEYPENELDNVLMESRYHIKDAKTFYLDAISTVDTALQLGQSTGQMSYTLAANTVHNTVSERLYSAEKEFQSCIEDIRKIEDQFTKLLANTVNKSKS